MENMSHELKNYERRIEWACASVRLHQNITFFNADIGGQLVILIFGVKVAVWKIEPLSVCRQVTLSIKKTIWLCNRVT